MLNVTFQNRLISTYFNSHNPHQRPEMNASRLNPLNAINEWKDYLIGWIVDKYLGKYLKDIRGKLKVRMLGGEIEVHGAELVQHALDEIKLPVGVRHGILGHLVIKNLWGGFGGGHSNGGAKVILSDLVLIVQPLSSFEVSEEHDKAEDKKLWESKEKKIKRHVKRWIDQMYRRYTGSAPVEPPTVFQQQFNDLIRLIEIDIHRIHVMLEDEHSNDKRPYTLGVVIDSIHLKPRETQYMDRSASSISSSSHSSSSSSNDHHHSHDDDHSTTDVQTKLINIENLRVYLNSGYIGELPIRPGVNHKWYSAQKVWKQRRAERLKSRRHSHGHLNMMSNVTNGRDGDGGGGGGGGHSRRLRHQRNGSMDHLSRTNSMNSGGRHGSTLRSDSVSADNQVANHHRAMMNDPHHKGRKDDKNNKNNNGGSSSVGSNNELHDLYIDFGPIIAAQFRLMRTSPHHENEEIDYPTGDIGEILKSLPKLNRSTPGGWTNNHHRDRNGHKTNKSKDHQHDDDLTSYFSKWSLLDVHLLSHIIEHKHDQNQILDGISAKIVFSENKSIIERYDDSPRKLINIHVSKVININLNYNQVRHLESFTLYLKGFERFELSRKLGHDNHCPRPQTTIQSAYDQKNSPEIGEIPMSQVAYTSICNQWFRYAVVVVTAGLRQKRAKENWSYIKTYMKRRRMYIDNWKKLQHNQKIWIADKTKLSQVSPTNHRLNGEYMYVRSLSDSRLSLVKHHEIDVKWNAKGGDHEKNENIKIEKEKKLSVDEIMLFKKLGYAELQLEYYKLEYEKERMKFRTLTLDKKEMTETDEQQARGNDPDSWLLKYIIGGSSSNSNSNNNSNSNSNNNSNNSNSSNATTTTSKLSRVETINKNANATSSHNLSRAEKTNLLQTISYDKLTNKYGILPKKYILEQYSINLYSVVITLITQDRNDKSFHTNMPRNNPDNKNVHILESKEEIWLNSIGCHYSNGVNNDQYDIIVGRVMVVDKVVMKDNTKRDNTNQMMDIERPKIWFSTMSMNVQSTWGYIPTLHSILRQKNERHALYSWMKQNINNVGSSKKPRSEKRKLIINDRRNIQFWIETEHYRTGRLKFGDHHDPSDLCDDKIYSAKRIEWADKIYVEFLKNYSQNILRNGHPNKETIHINTYPIKELIKGIELEIQTIKDLIKTPSSGGSILDVHPLLKKELDNIFIKLSELVYRDILNVYHLYIIKNWMPRYRQFRWWLGKNGDQFNYSKNALAIQIKHQDTLHAEVNSFTKKSRKIDSTSERRTNTRRKKSSRKKRTKKKKVNKMNEEKSDGVDILSSSGEDDDDENERDEENGEKNEQAANVAENGEDEEGENEEGEDSLYSPYRDLHKIHSLRPIVGSCATGYSISQTIAAAAGLSFHDVVMSDAHSYKTGTREEQEQERTATTTAGGGGSGSNYDYSHGGGVGETKTVGGRSEKNDMMNDALNVQSAEWTVKLDLCETTLTVNPDVINRIGAFLVSNESQFASTQQKLSSSQHIHDQTIQHDKKRREARRQHNAKKRAMRLVEESSEDELLKRPRKLLLAVNVKAMTIKMPAESASEVVSMKSAATAVARLTKRAESDFKMTLTLTIDGIKVTSKNSKGANDILHHASISKELMNGYYDMHDVRVSSIEVKFESDEQDVQRGSGGIGSIGNDMRKNAKVGTKMEQRITLVQELSLQYYVSRILDHPKWPREMYAIEIPQGIDIGPCTDDGLIKMMDWYAEWKSNIDFLIGMKSNGNNGGSGDSSSSSRSSSSSSNANGQENGTTSLSLLLSKNLDTSRAKNISEYVRTNGGSSVKGSGSGVHDGEEWSSDRILSGHSSSLRDGTSILPQKKPPMCPACCYRRGRLLQGQTGGVFWTKHLGKPYCDVEVTKNKMSRRKKGRRLALSSSEDLSHLSTTSHDDVPPPKSSKKDRKKDRKKNRNKKSVHNDRKEKEVKKKEEDHSTPVPLFTIETRNDDDMTDPMMMMMATQQQQQQQQHQDEATQQHMAMDITPSNIRNTPISLIPISSILLDSHQRRDNDEDNNREDRESFAEDEDEEDEDEDEEEDIYNNNYRAVKIRHGNRSGFCLDTEWTMDGWIKHPRREEITNKMRMKRKKRKMKEKRKVDSISIISSSREQKNKNHRNQRIAPTNFVEHINTSETSTEEMTAFIQHSNGNILFGWNNIDGRIGTYHRQKKQFYSCADDHPPLEKAEGYQISPISPQNNSKNKKNSTDSFNIAEIEKDRNKWCRLTIVGNTRKKTTKFYLNGLYRGTSKFCDTLKEGLKSHVKYISLDAKGDIYTKFKYYSTDLTLQQIDNTSTTSPQYETSVMKREERIIAFRLQNLRITTTINQERAQSRSSFYQSNKRHNKDTSSDSNNSSYVKSRELTFHLENLTADHIKWAYRDVSKIGVNAMAIEARTSMVDARSGRLLTPATGAPTAEHLFKLIAHESDRMTHATMKYGTIDRLVSILL